MRYCCMFEIMTIHMHKLVKISGIVNRQPWNRLNSYAAHSVFWARRKQDGVQIMSWRYSVYPGTLHAPIRARHIPVSNVRRQQQHSPEVFTWSRLAIESRLTYIALTFLLSGHFREVSEAFYRAVCKNRMSFHASSSSALNCSTSLASTTLLGK